MTTSGWRSSPPTPNDAREYRQLRMEVLVSHILIGGTVLSIALISTGLLWKYIESGGLRLDYELAGMNLFQFGASEIHLLVVGETRPRLLINMGIVVLMLTPFLRVLASMVYFFSVLKNWKYTLFTLFVLLVLTRSLFLQ